MLTRAWQWIADRPVFVGLMIVLGLSLYGLFDVEQAKQALCASFKQTQIANYRAAIRLPPPGATPEQLAARLTLLHGDIRRVKKTPCNS